MATLISPVEAEEWRGRLSALAESPPPPTDAQVQRAEALVKELLGSTKADHEETGTELSRFEGALEALAAGSIESPGLEDRLNRELDVPRVPEDESQPAASKSPGGQEELVAVLEAPLMSAGSKQVVATLRFTDGVTFVIHRGLEPVEAEEYWSVELVDDIGTKYDFSAVVGGDSWEWLSFSTPLSVSARWIELRGIARSGIRVRL